MSSIVENCKCKIQYFNCEKIKNYHIAFFLNFLFLLLFLCISTPKYETSDDFVMSSIAAGALGQGNNPYLIYINVILGYVIKFLNTIVYPYNTYFFMMIIMGFFSCFNISLVLFKRLKKTTAIVLIVALLSFFGNDIYGMIQFTKIASVAIVSGSLLLLDELFEDTIRYPIILWSGLCIIVGTMIRFSSSYLVGLFLIAFIILHREKYKNKSKKYFYKRLSIGFALVFIILGLKKIDDFAYLKNPSYSYFKQFGKVRAMIVDGPDEGYDMYKNIFQDLNLSENDYISIRKWNMSDSQYITYSKLLRIGEKLKIFHKKQKRNIYMLKDRILKRKYVYQPIFWICLILLIYGILFSKKKINFLFYGLLLAFYNFYFIYIDRTLYRIEMSLYFIYFVLCLYDIDNMKRIERYGISLLALSVILFTNIPVNYSFTSYYELITKEFNESGDYNRNRYSINPYKYEGFYQLHQEMQSHPNNRYVLGFHSTVQLLYFEQKPWIQNKYMFEKNSIEISGVTINYPDQIKRASELGINNLIRDLPKKNIYYIDNLYSNVILRYLQEHVNKNITKKLYKKIDGLSIWSYRME